MRWHWMRRWPAGPGSSWPRSRPCPPPTAQAGCWSTPAGPVIALDGKTLRGSAPRATPEQAATAAHGGGRSHLVAACDHASGVALGQVACSPEAGTGGEVAAALALAAALDERG